MSDTEAQTVAYVASSQHDSAAPPVSETGIIGWVRQNLLSSWSNALLTFIVIFVLFWIVPGIVEWAFIKSVWRAPSVDDCFRIMAERFGEGERGACWAVVYNRFDQLIYGFYPPSQRWRPNLAIVMLAIAVVPVLFQTLRPLAYAMGAFLVGKVLYTLVVLAMGDKADVLMSANTVVAAAALVLALVVGGPGARRYWFAFTLIYPLLAYLLIWGGLILDPIPTARIGGFLLTIIIGITGIAASLPIGILLALGRQSRLPALKTLCVVFIEFIRGVPLITLLFVASTLLNYFLPPGTNFDLLLRVLIMVTLFASAYMAEVIRGGLASLPKGQFEAADTLGLTYWQSMRLIILPQALKVSIPGIVNTFIGLFKDTTLVSIINLLDPLGIIKPILADTTWNGIIAELYIFIALVFFVCCFSMGRYSMFLETKLRASEAL